tara:strand:+ start:173 stop:412 length:240 start_codon:yes stop_codon:yes gene_type:complete
MNIKRLIHGKFSKYIISAIIGIGLATLFRKACNSRNCLVFKAPAIQKIKNQIFKYNDKCYKFNEQVGSCDENKKIVEIA